MPLISAKELLAAGAHFGHSVSRWNPKMAPFILGKQNRIHIINLRETVRGIVAAYFFLRRIVSEGDQVLFVGTKRQAREQITQHAQRVEMPYVSERWLGGTLTNLPTIRIQVKRLVELETMSAEGRFASLSKKMQSAYNREKRKIKRNLDGIRNMDRLPGALFVIDPKVEKNAVHEANRLAIPVVAILDTDADPDPVELPIPANDDAIRANELIVAKMADACQEGMNLRKSMPEGMRRKREEAMRKQAEEQAIGAVSVAGRFRDRGP